MVDDKYEIETLYLQKWCRIIKPKRTFIAYLQKNKI